HLPRPPPRHLVGCDQPGRSPRRLGVDGQDGAALGHRHVLRGPLLRGTPRPRRERRISTRRPTPPLRRRGSSPPALGHRDRPRDLPVRRLLGWVAGIAISPDGRRALSSENADPYLRLWDIATGREIYHYEVLYDWLTRGTFTRDGRQVIWPAFDGVLLVWD